MAPPPSQRLPKTFILGTSYISMQRSAQDYRNILQRLGCLSESLEEAEVVIIHASLAEVSDMLLTMPSLAERYLVGYLVWEADRLPPKAHRLVSYFDEVWTPSWYSARSLLPVAQKLRWLPHVVRPPTPPSDEAVATLNRLLGPPGHCALLQIGQAEDRRKNFGEATDAFMAASYGRPGLTLVQKPIEFMDGPHRHRLTARSHGQITEVSGAFADDLISALYARSHYVLSTHHGEGWGLTLSEGMALGVPGIAPNYSGNLAFMGPTSGILIEGYEAPVRDNDRTRNFGAPMHWHYSFGGAAEAAIGQAYDAIGTPAYDRMSQEAARISKVYDFRHVSVLMAHLLRHLAQSAYFTKPRPERPPFVLA